MKRIVIPLLAVFFSAASFAAEVPPATWQGGFAGEIEGLSGPRRSVVAFPEKMAEPLVISLPGKLPAGEYAVRLMVRPSSVAGEIAFKTVLKIQTDSGMAVEAPGEEFGRFHQPEPRELRFVHKGGACTIRLSATTDGKRIETLQTAAQFKRGVKPKISESLEDDLAADLELEDRIDPASSVYFVVDSVEVVPLTRSGRVAAVDVDRVRYDPGMTLKAKVTVEDVARKGGRGTLRMFLEHGVRDRTEVFSQSVELKPEPQEIAAELRLPKEELGYALVAEYRSDDGKDRSEAAEYFGIAENFQRVAVFGLSGGHGSTKASEAGMRKLFKEAKKRYGNCGEASMWGEDDMVELTPDTDYWFSGQTAYHMSKKGIQQSIRIGHEYGMSFITYGKMVMGGYLGWKTAYDYPLDCRTQYFYPVGMNDGVDVQGLDLYRNKEFAIYENMPKPGKRPFDAFTAPWCPINPDNTPRMVKIAAEEMAASAKMFGWDAVRWDGHPRGGGQCGGNGMPYDAAAARRTQSLIRYFKDIVARQAPNFRHGYNYLSIQPKPESYWAVEDFELDEICRGGGLVMNESIGNATLGPFGYLAANLQVEGDICRERGGYFLGIHGGHGKRDGMVEDALWAAGGARSYNGGSLEFNRYVTRYSQYCFDERLRRIVTPEKVLAPTAATKLWWQPFVYETPWADGKRQLVVNLLNIPQQEMRQGEQGPEKYTLEPGADPVEFALTLPAGMKALAVNFIDPKSLSVTSLPLDGGRFGVPAVTLWQVAVVDLEVAENGPSLGALHGPPQTVGVKRPQKDDKSPPAELVLSPEKAVWEVNKDMSALAPRDAGATMDAGAMQRAALPPQQREAAILEIRAKNSIDSPNVLKGWWKGGSLPADLKLKDKPPAYGDMTPRRDGRFDIFHGRGCMDYKLRLPEVFLRLPRFQVHDAPLAGGHGNPAGYTLSNRLSWRQYPEFDLLLYTSIPHSAMGPENCYAMVDYVKAGGAVLFTGGEYAFGKGGYQYTVLERELLPVLCAVTVDTRYADPPLPMEPGPDFVELGVPLDFKAQPSFFVWNEVALKDEPGIKVFLKSGNIPVLVGRQVGKGRVACLLADHRGTSENGVTAFFEWDEWPRLAEAVFRWLAPQAFEDRPAAPPPAQAASDAVLATMQSLADETDTEAVLADISALEQAPADASLAGLDAGVISVPTSAAPSGPVDAKAVAILNEALATPASAELDRLMLQACLSPTRLSDDLRWRLFDRVRGMPPDVIREAGREGLKAQDESVRRLAVQMLAVAGAPEFAAELSRKAEGLEETLLARERALALGVVQYPGSELVAEGVKRVAAWDAEEAATKKTYTGGAEFSLAAPEVPLLGSEALFARAAWLHSLVRHDPAVYAARFVREWLLLSQYVVYCDRTVASVWGDKQMPPKLKQAKAQGWQQLRADLLRLKELGRSQVVALADSRPESVAEGFCRAHFTQEYRAALNILGTLEPAAAAKVWESMKSPANMDLAALAKLWRERRASKESR